MYLSSYSRLMKGDRYICHVKLGSYSHSSEDLVFAQGEQTSEHTFTKTTSSKDYKFKVLPLCAHAMEETMVDVGGETSVYKVSGFSLVITRKSSTDLAEYIIVLSMLVVMAIFSSCLPLFSRSAGFVACTALSISDYIPHGSVWRNEPGSGLQPCLPVLHLCDLPGVLSSDGHL
jgi:hypothetical protein